MYVCCFTPVFSSDENKSVFTLKTLSFGQNLFASMFKCSCFSWYNYP